MKQFKNMTREDLHQLRSEIVLNSLYRHDYENSFGFEPSDIHKFFDGFYDFMWTCAEEEDNTNDGRVTHDYVIQHYDDDDTLERWFYMFEDFDWVHNVSEE